MKHQAEKQNSRVLDPGRTVLIFAGNPVDRKETDKINFFRNGVDNAVRTGFIYRINNSFTEFEECWKCLAADGGLPDSVFIEEHANTMSGS